MPDWKDEAKDKVDQGKDKVNEDKGRMKQKVDDMKNHDKNRNDDSGMSDQAEDNTLFDL